MVLDRELSKIKVISRVQMVWLNWWKGGSMWTWQWTFSKLWKWCVCAVLAHLKHKLSTLLKLYTYISYMPLITYQQISKVLKLCDKALSKRAERGECFGTFKAHIEYIHGTSQVHFTGYCEMHLSPKKKRTLFLAHRLQTIERSPFEHTRFTKQNFCAVKLYQYDYLYIL